MNNNQNGSIIILPALLTLIILIIGGYLFMHSQQDTNATINAPRTEEVKEKQPEVEKKHTEFPITAVSAVQEGVVVNAEAQLPQSFTGICQFTFTSKNTFKVAGKHANISDKSSCSVSLPVSDFDPGYWDVGVFFLSNSGEYSGLSDKKFLQIK